MGRMGRFPSTDNGEIEGGRTRSASVFIPPEIPIYTINLHGNDGPILYVNRSLRGLYVGRSTAASLLVRIVYPFGMSAHSDYCLVHEDASAAGNLNARRLG